MKQLVSSHAQDVAVNCGHARNAPVFGMPGQEHINGFHFLHGAFDQPIRKFTHVLFGLVMQRPKSFAHAVK
jgi:hypothetical protein